MHTVAAIKEGNYAAFDEAYQLLHIKVFRFFLKRVLLHNIAEDLTQQCFIRLWQFRHTLSEDHTLDKQLFVIAHSLLINHIKKESTEKKYKTGYTQVYPLTQHTDAEEAFTRKDQLQAALVNLPPVRQKVMIMRLVHGYTNKEIAAQLSVSVKTVEDHMLKAVRTMRKLITIVWLAGLLCHETPTNRPSTATPASRASHLLY